MMKKSYFLILLMLISPFVFSQYITPGTGINWNFEELVVYSEGAVIYEDGAYFILENITISVNDTISVLTNETVKLSHEVLVEVFGVVLFNPPENLLLTAIDSLQSYTGLRIDNSDNSTFRNCTFEFGNGIKLIDSDIQIDHCVFRKNENNYATGILDLFGSAPEISNSIFRHNAGPAVLSSANGNSSPKIFNNLIDENVTANINMPQINLGSSMADDTIKIVGNIINGLYDNAGGIAVSTLAGGVLNCIIRDNVIDANRYGVAVYGNNIYSYIVDNIISDNNIQGDPYLGGSGINFYGNTTNISIVQGNTIKGNLWGITVQIEALPDMGNSFEGISTGFNRIFENENNEGVFALYNSTPNDLNAQNNFWGSTDPDVVEEYIFHHPDDNSLGMVNFIPLWDTISNIQKKYFYLSRIHNVYPLPFDDELHIVFNNETENNRSLTIFVYDVFGRIRKEFVSENSNVFLAMPELEKGIYFLEIRDKTFRETIKIQK